MGDACKEALQELQRASQDFQEHSISSKTDQIESLQSENVELRRKLQEEKQMTAELGTQLKNGQLKDTRWWVSPSSGLSEQEKNRMQKKIHNLEEIRDKRDRDMKKWQHEVTRLTSQAENLEKENKNLEKANIELRGLVQ